MSGEFDPTLELGLPSDKMFICGCRGFLTRNDSVRDLCERIITDGGHFYDVLCRYDSLVTYVLGREEAVAGNVPKFAIPFLKAFGATDNIMFEDSKKDLRLMPESKTTLDYLSKLMPSFITTSAYEQSILALDNEMDVPLCEYACTESDIDHCMMDRVASKNLRKVAETICSLEIPDVEYLLNVPMNLDKKDIKITNTLDDALADGMDPMGRSLMETCIPMNSSKKAYRLLDLRRQNSIDLDGTVYIGGDHTDFQTMDLIRDGNGLSISFNGSEFALRGSNVAVISESATVGAVLAHVFYDKGIQAVYDLIEMWDKDLLDSGDFPDRNLADRMLSEPGPFPELYVTADEELADLKEKSEKARKRIMSR